LEDGPDGPMTGLNGNRICLSHSRRGESVPCPEAQIGQISDAFYGIRRSSPEAGPRRRRRRAAFCERQVMTYEEMAILTFLRGKPDSLVGRREIARKALRRIDFEENPHWVDAPLASLMDRRLLEQDEGGHYRIRKEVA